MYMLKHDRTMAANLKRRVCVVGAGIIGISSAISLIETIPNVDVTIVAETFSSLDIASSVSGGLWNPRETLNGTPLYRLQKWTRATWDHSLPLALSEEASKIGIQFLPCYRICPELIAEEGDPWWKDDVIGFRRVPQKEMQQLFPTLKDGYSYMTIITDNGLYLPHLLQRFKSQGGRVLQKRIASLAEFLGEYDIVVNCSGLGAKWLARDDSVGPIRGQIIKVRAPLQSFAMMIDYRKGMKKDGDRSLYVFPRNGEVILGGTLQRDRWDTTPCPEDRKDILERTSKVLPNLKGCEIVKELVGLRPNRPDGVRLEAETMDYGSHQLDVVHNYGHEGNGVTLHWGCAQEATQLVQEILSRSSLQSKL